MGAGAELLVVSFGAIGCFSIGAFFAAFFNRAAARACAGLAFVIVALFLC
jgi:hypothetical protein